MNKQLDFYSQRHRNFRAWCHNPDDITEGAMYYDVGVLKYGDCIIDNDHMDIDESVKIMDYIGIEDKNNLEVYEGDILKWKDIIVVVVFSNGKFILRKIKDSHFAFYEVMRAENRFEVIGNIFENYNLI